MSGGPIMQGDELVCGRPADSQDTGCLVDREHQREPLQGLRPGRRVQPRPRAPADGERRDVGVACWTGRPSSASSFTSPGPLPTSLDSRVCAHRRRNAQAAVGRVWESGPASAAAGGAGAVAGRRGAGRRVPAGRERGCRGGRWGRLAHYAQPCGDRVSSRAAVRSSRGTGPGAIGGGRRLVAPATTRPRLATSPGGGVVAQDHSVARHNSRERPEASNTIREEQEHGDFLLPFPRSVHPHDARSHRHPSDALPETGRLHMTEWMRWRVEPPGRRSAHSAPHSRHALNRATPRPGTEWQLLAPLCS